MKEDQLYNYVQKWLRAQGLSTEVTGGKKKGGRWGNPDVMGVQVHALPEGQPDQIEVWAVEVKGDVNPTSVYTAAAYQRFAHRCWAAVYHTRGGAEDGTLWDFLINEAERLRVGLLVLRPSGKGVACKLRLSAPFVQPSSQEVYRALGDLWPERVTRCPLCGKVAFSGRTDSTKAQGVLAQACQVCRRDLHQLAIEAVVKVLEGRGDVEQELEEPGAPRNLSEWGALQTRLGHKERYVQTMVAAVQAFEGAVRNWGWEFDMVFRNNYVAFRVASRTVFSVHWLGSRSFAVVAKVPKALAEVPPEEWPALHGRYQDDFKQARYKIDPQRVDPEQFRAVVEEARRNVHSKRTRIKRISAQDL